MFATMAEAALKCQCITMQRKMVLEDRLEYARTEANLQQKLSNIEAANVKARIDAEAMKQAEIDKINMVNEKYPHTSTWHHRNRLSQTS